MNTKAGLLLIWILLFSLQNSAFGFIKSGITKSLDNTYKASLQMYLLPALRYRLCPWSHCHNPLFTLCDRCLKRWRSVPKSGKPAILHSLRLELKSLFHTILQSMPENSLCIIQFQWCSYHMGPIVKIWMCRFVKVLLLVYYICMWIKPFWKSRHISMSKLLFHSCIFLREMVQKYGV